MALTRGDKITGFEGIDFGGNKYAIVLDMEPAGDGKVLLSLYYPESKSARKYKVSDGLSGMTDPTPPYDEGPENEEYDIPSSPVDYLRLESPNRSQLPIRMNLPDSYFPDDPNYPSTLTDVSWRPEMRRTPFPRFYNTRKRSGMRYRRRLAARPLPPDLDTIYDEFEDKYLDQGSGAYEHDLAGRVADEVLTGVPTQDLTWWMEFINSLDGWELAALLPTKALKVGLGHLLLEVLHNNLNDLEDPNPTHEDYPGQRYP